MSTKSENQFKFLKSGAFGYDVVIRATGAMLGTIRRAGKGWRATIAAVGNPANGWSTTTTTRADAAAAMATQTSAIADVESMLTTKLEVIVPSPDGAFTSNDETGSVCGVCGWTSTHGGHAFCPYCASKAKPVVKAVDWTLMDNRDLLKSYRFFRKQGGGIVGRMAECALHMARAELHAETEGWGVAWEFDHDGDLGDHSYWCAEAKRAEREHRKPACVHETHVAVLSDETGKTMASLGGIIDPSGDYMRIVSAELAMEAMERADETPPAPPAKTGYTDCACRDCMEIAIGVPGKAYCHGCVDAGCPDYQGQPGMSQECQRMDAYGETDHDTGETPVSSGIVTPGEPTSGMTARAAAERSDMPFCRALQAGAQSDVRTVGTRLGRLLTALDDEINGYVAEGEIIEATGDLRRKMIMRLRAEGWRVTYLGDKGRWQVLPANGKVR